MLLNHCVKGGCTPCKISLGKILLESKAEKAYMLFQEAANKGSASGMIQLGLCFLGGLGVDEDHEKAFKIVKEASESNPEGKIYVGLCLENGLGVEKNNLEALSSCEAGFGDIEHVEDKSPAAGFIVKHELYESQLFLQAIAEGSEHGMARLGMLYSHGYNVYWDSFEAIRLLLLAEKKGSNIAAVELGKMYYEGGGVEKDDIAAVAHLSPPSVNGFIPATIELAKHFYEGAGVVQDRAWEVSIEKRHQSLSFSKRCIGWI